jgi:endoglucanase
MNELLKQLSEAVGVSGDEKAIRLIVRDHIADHVDEWHVDAMGNLIALKKGTGASDLRVLVDAHMDEVGIIITGIDSNGTLQFAKIGGVDDRVLAGAVMQIGPNKIKGVIGLRPVHLISSAAESSKVVPSASLRIDIGASSKDNAAAKVKIGDRGTFVAEYEEIGERDEPTMALGKAFDNRAGCAALIELLRGERYPFDLYASFSVQEEIGMRGVRVVSYAVKPDVAFVLECTPAYDFPGTEDRSPNAYCGRGPVLYVMDSAMIQDPRLVQHIMRAGRARDIPFHVRQPGGGGTNTGPIQRADTGMPAATIGLPGRHLHTPSIIINLADYANYVKLADAALRDLTRETIIRR